MKASAPLWKKKFQRWFITKILTLLIRITGYTARVRQINKEVLKDTIKEHGSVIVATWHKNIFFSIWLLRNHDLTALISTVRIFVINQRRNFFFHIRADAFIKSKIIELNEFVSLFRIIFYHKQHELNKSLAVKTNCVFSF